MRIFGRQYCPVNLRIVQGRVTTGGTIVVIVLVGAAGAGHPREQTLAMEYVVTYGPNQRLRALWFVIGDDGVMIDDIVEKSIEQHHQP
jgi:hypothetical protein